MYTALCYYYINFVHSRGVGPTVSKFVVYSRPGSSRTVSLVATQSHDQSAYIYTYRCPVYVLDHSALRSTRSSKSRSYSTATHVHSVTRSLSLVLLETFTSIAKSLSFITLTSSKVTQLLLLVRFIKGDNAPVYF